MHGHIYKQIKRTVTRNGNIVTHMQWARRFLVLVADGRLFLFKANPTVTTAPITYLPVTATLTTFRKGTLSAVREEKSGEEEAQEEEEKEREHQQRDRYVITASGVGLTLAGQVQQRSWLLSDVGDDSVDGNAGCADTDGGNSISDSIFNWSAAFDSVLADTGTISPLAPPSPESPLAVFGASSTATTYASPYTSYSSYNSYNSYNNNPYNNLYSNYNNYSPLDYYHIHENIVYSPVSPNSPNMPSIPTMQRTFSSPTVDYLAVGERSVDGFEMRRSISSKSASNYSGGLGRVNSVSRKPPRPPPANSQTHTTANNSQQAAAAKAASKSAGSRKASWLDLILNPV
ncbi:hypothetical protein HK100_011332 [Physocladia obscura]|uniref:PH domain-containing protein n=1 Tax=Physocladia obscura TaxID=109957 RepID=A0AAD5XHX3_9FUNG|nr:hypothetical protein HK100_011332 [Physocladia obscura]